MSERCQEVLEELQAIAEVDYKKFNSKIIPTRQRTLGVRVPALRKIARRIAKDGAEPFIEADKGDIFEMVMLEGMVLSYLNKPFTELLHYTEKFLGKVDNWAQIDTTICNFKHIQKEKEEVLPVVEEWLNSEEEFVVRAGLVILLAHYVEKQYLETIFSLSESVRHSGHYVFMGNAWLISVCMAKYPAETIEFFRKNRLDRETHNKAIQKSRESYRVSKENKQILQGLRR